MNEHPEKMSHYKKLSGDSTVWGISFPRNNAQKGKFEKYNNNRISVNVYQEIEVMPDCPSFILDHRFTKISDAQHHVDLLLTTDENGKSHYVYIKDIDKLLSRQINSSTHKSLPVLLTPIQK